jgi:hypothetical protein
MCDPDGGQKGSMKVWPRRACLLGKNQGFRVVILPDGEDHLEDVVCDKDRKIRNLEYEIRERVDPDHTKGDGSRGPDFAQGQ